MKTIALFVKDFQKGTKISEKILAMNFQVEFVEKIENLSRQHFFIIIDLDNKDFANESFIRGIKSISDFFIIGYMSSMVKHSVDTYKKYGCNLILSGGSLIKNIESLTNEISNRISPG